MARINSNIPSLIARSNLNRANDELQTRLQRLSTGLRINRGADDPAGLIISERLRSEVNGLNQAVNNSNRASSVIATTEGALAEVGDLLTSIRGLVVEAANTGAVSDEERRANQLQIDSAIESITRISNATSFGGLKLLNGALDYVLSGVDGTNISKAQVFGANFASRNNIQVDVRVLGSAQTGSLYLSGNATGTVLSATQLRIAGTLGVQSFDVASGQSYAEVVLAINNFKAATGVSASLINNNAASGIRFSSTTFGSKSFVSVERVGGPASGGYFRTYNVRGNAPIDSSFDWATLFGNGLLDAANRDSGKDVQAIVNGNLANGDGLKVSLQSQTSVSVELLLDSAFATTPNAAAGTVFYITGGGALYQLGGQINNSQQTNIGLQSIAAARLGGTLLSGQLLFLDSIRTGGRNDLRSAKFEDASKVLDSAIDEISLLRGRLGAFERNTLQTNVRSLQAAVENLTASESRIRDADFAAETASLTRAQVLVSAATSVLQLANQQSQQVLQLLGG
jgi:flagellin